MYAEAQNEVSGPDGTVYAAIDRVMNAAIYNSENQQIVKRTFNKLRDYWWPVPQIQRDLNPNLAQNDNY